MKKIGIIFLVILSLTFASCQKLNLTKDREDIIVEYAADVVLENDVNYDNKYVNIKETQTSKQEQTTKNNEQTTSNQENNGNQETNKNQETNPNQETTSKLEEKYTSITKAFNLNGFNINLKGYEVLDSYPKVDDGSYAFILKAIENSKLLIVKLEVENISGQEKKLSMLEQSYRIRGIINEDKRLNAQVTMLLDAFNTFNGTFKAAEKKNLVIVFQVPDEYTKDIKTLELSATKDSKTSLVLVK